MSSSDKRGSTSAATQALNEVSHPSEKLRQVSGHWIGSTPVMPSDIRKSASLQQQSAVTNYLSQTHMNIQHPDMATVEKRAMAFQRWGPVEDTILHKTQTALTNYQSPEFTLSSHMVHNERAVLADRADRLRSEHSDIADTTLSDQVTKMTTTRAQGAGHAYDTLTDMLIHGKQGPLTMEQSALGVESTIVGHHVLDKTAQYSPDNPRMQASRGIDPTSQRTSSAVASPFGVDLSPDEGTALRDKLGLPIMMGTSGSASDVVRSYQHTVGQLRQQHPKTTFMSAEEHHEPLKALTFNWMRAGAPMLNVRKLLSENQAKHGQEKMSVPAPTATQTHTYPEIAAGIDLTLKGNTPKNLEESTLRSQHFMTRIKEGN